MGDAAVLRSAEDSPARRSQSQWRTVPRPAVGRRQVGVDRRSAAAPLRLSDAGGGEEGRRGGAVSRRTGRDGPATPGFPGWISGQMPPARMAWRLDDHQGAGRFLSGEGMPIPESTLSRWSHHQAGTAPKQAHVSIREALDAYSWPSEVKYEVFLQGSYKNDTNLRGDSDVDVVVRLAHRLRPRVATLTGEQLQEDASHQAAHQGWKSFGLTDLRLKTFSERSNHGSWRPLAQPARLASRSLLTSSVPSASARSRPTPLYA